MYTIQIEGRLCKVTRMFDVEGNETLVPSECIWLVAADPNGGWWETSATERDLRRGLH